MLAQQFILARDLAAAPETLQGDMRGIAFDAHAQKDALHG